MQYACIAGFASHLGSTRNLHGSAVDLIHDEIDMAVLVAKKAMHDFSKTSTCPIDTVIFATCGIRQIFPSGAAAIANALGFSCNSFDVTAGCASMSNAVDTASRMSGTILVVCSDNLSRTIDPDDPSHTPLKAFADGACAVIICHNNKTGHRIIASHGETRGSWRNFYRSQNGRLLRNLPQEAKKDLSASYIQSWARISQKLLSYCSEGELPFIFANQGDAKLFPTLLDSLGMKNEQLVITNHGHAGGADPWIAFMSHTPPKGSKAILLGSGIGFHFHGLLLEVEK